MRVIIYYRRAFIRLATDWFNCLTFRNVVMHKLLKLHQNFGNLLMQQQFWLFFQKNWLDFPINVFIVDAGFRSANELASVKSTQVSIV